MNFSKKRLPMHSFKCMVQVVKRVAVKIAISCQDKTDDVTADGVAANYSISLFQPLFFYKSVESKMQTDKILIATTYPLRPL